MNLLYAHDPVVMTAAKAVGQHKRVRFVEDWKSHVASIYLIATNWPEYRQLMDNPTELSERYLTHELFQNIPNVRYLSVLISKASEKYGKQVHEVPYAQSVHGEAEIEAGSKSLRTSTQMGHNVSEMEARRRDVFKEIGLMTNSGTSSLMFAAEAAELQLVLK